MASRPTVGQPKLYIAVATRLHLRNPIYFPQFISMAYKVRKQAEQTRGNEMAAIGGIPLVNRFETLSVWTDRPSMLAFLKTEPHATAIRKMAKWGSGKSKFAEWTTVNRVVGWKEAHEHLKTNATNYQRPKAR